MTAAEAINTVIGIAEEEIGYLEKRSNRQLDSKTANAGSGNYTKYWRDIAPSYQAQPWCAGFVSWCFYKAFGLAAARKLLFQSTLPRGERPGGHCHQRQNTQVFWYCPYPDRLLFCNRRFSAWRNLWAGNHYLRLYRRSGSSDLYAIFRALLQKNNRKLKPYPAAMLS